MKLILPLATIILFTHPGSAIFCFECIYTDVEGDPSSDDCADPFDITDRGSIPVPIDCDKKLEDEELAIEQDPRCTEARVKGWELPAYCVLPLTKKYTHCRIMWITFNTMGLIKPTRIVRSCATDIAERLGQMHYNTGSEGTSTEVYHCNYDNCNGASWARSNALLLLISLLGSLLLRNSI